MGHICCNYQNHTKHCPRPSTKGQSKHCSLLERNVSDKLIISRFITISFGLLNPCDSCGYTTGWTVESMINKSLILFLFAGRRMRTRPGGWSNPPVWTTCWTGSRTTRSSGWPSWPSWPLSRWWSPWSLPTSFRKWRRSRRWGEWCCRHYVGTR